MRKKIVLSLFGVLFLVSVLPVWQYFSSKPDQRVLVFQDDLLFQMQNKPEIVFSMKDNGFTDGVLFYVFQLSSEEMKTSLAENHMAGWSRLPMKPYLIEGVLDELAGSTHDAERAYYDQYLSAEHGYYRIQNEKKMPIAPTSFGDDQVYHQVSGAVIDTEKNQISYFHWYN